MAGTGFEKAGASQSCPFAPRLVGWSSRGEGSLFRFEGSGPCLWTVIFGGGHPPPVSLQSVCIAPGLKESLETGFGQSFPSYFFENICTSMFIAVLFTIAKTWKHPKCSTDERIKKMWYKYTMEYYPVIKKNELFLSVTTWLDLDDTG